MQCPVDGTTLAMTERHSVEIDYCPDCRGVWLDRGELDRIIDHATAELARPGREVSDVRQRAGAGAPESHHEHHEHRSDPDSRGGAAQKDKPRKSRFAALSDLLGGGED